MRVKKNQSKKQPSKNTPKNQGVVEQMPELVFNPISTENIPMESAETTPDAVVANEPIAEEVAPISKTIEQQNAEKANELEAGNVTINRLPMDEVAESLVQVDEGNLIAYEEIVGAEQTETAPIESELEMTDEYAKESLDKYTDEQLTGILKVMIDFDLQTAFLGLRGSEVFLYSIPQEDCGVITIEEVKDRLNLPQNEE
jgi:hypothetical protein